MYAVTQLFIYPIKSLGGISLSSALITDRGLQYDRRWMLVDESNVFISQRTVPEMALLKVSLREEGLMVYHSSDPDSAVTVPFFSMSKNVIEVKVWDDTCLALPVSQDLDNWFSGKLNMRCKLVFMPEDSHRLVDQRYAKNHEITTFSDAYPILMIGEQSLNYLNQKLLEPLPINRFRPNIVFSGGEPHDEDSMEHFKIRDVDFYGVKLSARCMVITIDQERAIKGKEPLKTLSTYRLRNSKIYFGQNLIFKGKGPIHVGDELKVIAKKETIFNRLPENFN